MQTTIGEIERFMMGHHVRIDGLLAASELGDGSIEEASYRRFRHHLLRHIDMEEKVLLPEARARRGRQMLALAAQLEREHRAIAHLLVRSPTAERLDELRVALGRYNALEEGPDGLYALCDALAGADAPAIVARLRAQPSAPLAPCDRPAPVR